MTIWHSLASNFKSEFCFAGAGAGKGMKNYGDYLRGGSTKYLTDTFLWSGEGGGYDITERPEFMGYSGRVY